MKPARRLGLQFERLVKIVDRLRGEQGCPWDKEQDEKSIASFFLEEVYEAVDAVWADDAQALQEELGDVLLEVVFLAQIAQEKEAFAIADVINGIIKKMIRRHPHVFGSATFSSAERVRDAWRRQKNAEKERRTVFEGLARSTPSLLAAYQIGQRVSAFGFDWSQPRDVLEKVKEEIGELRKALERRKRKDIAEEIGDLFFALASFSRLLDLNPELVLRRANQKFCRRFLALEKELRERGKGLGEASLKDMDEMWELVKKEKAGKERKTTAQKRPRRL